MIIIYCVIQLLVCAGNVLFLKNSDVFWGLNDYNCLIVHKLDFSFEPYCFIPMCFISINFYVL